jgi:hypothetical protein
MARKTESTNLEAQDWMEALLTELLRGIDPEHRAIVKTMLKRAVVARLRRKELTLLRGGRYEPRPDTLKGECTL